MAVAVAGVGLLGRDGGIVSAVDIVSLGGENLIDEVGKHLAHQVWEGLDEKLFEIRDGIEVMGASDHRRHIAFEDRYELIRKIPAVVALSCTSTSLTAGYR